METRPMNEKEVARMEKSAKGSRIFGCVLIILALPFFYFVIRGIASKDTGFIIAGAFFILSGWLLALKQFLFARKCVKDCEEAIAGMDWGTVSMRSWGEKGSHYFYACGRKWHVPYGIWKGFDDGDEIEIHFALNTRDLLFVKDSKGEKYKLY